MENINLNTTDTEKIEENKEISETKQKISEKINYIFGNLKENENTPKNIVKNFYSDPKSKIEKLENIYLNIKNNHKSLENIISKIENFVEINISEIENDIFWEKLFFEIKKDLEVFGKDEKISILNTLETYFFQVYKTQKIYKIYKNNPKNFFLENKNFKFFLEKNNLNFSDDIEFEIFKGSLTIKMSKKNFQTWEKFLYNDTNLELENGGFVITDENNFSIIYLNKDSKHSQETVKIHEQRHVLNHIIMNNEYNKIIKNLENQADKNYKIIHKNILDFAFILLKDELIAQVKGGEKAENLNKIIKNSYDFLSFYRNKNVPNFMELENKFNILRKNYIEIFVKLLNENVSLDILMITPISKWKNLAKIKNLQKAIARSNEEKDYENGDLENGVFDEKGFLKNGNKYFKELKNEKVKYESGDFKDGILENGYQISEKKSFDKEKNFILNYFRNGKIVEKINFYLGNYEISKNTLEVIGLGRLEFFFKDLKIFFDGDFKINSGEIEILNGKIFIKKKKEKFSLEIKDGKIEENSKDFKKFQNFYGKNKNINDFLNQNQKKFLKNIDFEEKILNNIEKFFDKIQILINFFKSKI